MGRLDGTRKMGSAVFYSKMGRLRRLGSSGVLISLGRLRRFGEGLQLWRNEQPGKLPVLHPVLGEIFSQSDHGLLET